MLVRDVDTLCNFQINPGGWRPSCFQMMLNLNCTTFIVAVLRESTNIPACKCMNLPQGQHESYTAIVGCQWYWNMNFSIQMQSRWKFEERYAVVSESAARELLFARGACLSALIMNVTFCLLLSAESGTGLALRDWLGVAPGTSWEVDERIIRASREGDVPARNCCLVWCI